MAETLQLSRNTKVYVRDVDSEFAGTANNTNTWWEIPVLDGFAFSQGTESVEITLLEAADSTNKSRRGRLAFNTALAPVEWSLTTYARPFKGAGARSNTNGIVDHAAGFMHAVEESLWAYMVLGAGEVYGSNTGSGARQAGANWGPRGSNTGSSTQGVFSNTSVLEIDFDKSNKASLRNFELIFAMSSTGNSSAIDTVYRISDAVVNAVTLDFDIEGIAQLQWSGFGRSIISTNSIGSLLPAANAVTEGINSTNSFIRNRLSTVNIGTTEAAFGAWPANTKYYNVILTGGSITIDNGITYVTPEELAKVNIPLGHQTGTRSVTGTMTAYLDDDYSANSSGALFRNMSSNSSLARNNFNLVFSIGGASSPKVEIIIPQAHLEVPTHSVDDVIGLEVNFNALPTDIASTNEATIRYYGLTPV